MLGPRSEWRLNALQRKCGDGVPRTCDARWYLLSRKRDHCLRPSMRTAACLFRMPAPSWSSRSRSCWRKT